MSGSYLTLYSVCISPLSRAYFSLFISSLFKNIAVHTYLQWLTNTTIWLLIALEIRKLRLSKMTYPSLSPTFSIIVSLFLSLASFSVDLSVNLFLLFFFSLSLSLSLSLSFSLSHDPNSNSVWQLVLIHLEPVMNLAEYHSLSPSLSPLSLSICDYLMFSVYPQ